jgi:hypothetical protein
MVGVPARAGEECGGRIDGVRADGRTEVEERVHDITPHTATHFSDSSRCRAQLEPFERRRRHTAPAVGGAVDRLTVTRTGRRSVWKRGADRALPMRVAARTARTTRIPLESVASRSIYSKSGRFTRMPDDLLEQPASRANTAGPSTLRPMAGTSWSRTEYTRPFEQTEPLFEQIERRCECSTAVEGSSCVSQALRR